jgi:phage terminase small subunit
LKLLAGTRSSRVNADEPTLPTGIPTPPDYVEFDETALGFWEEVAPIVHQMGVLTEADRHALGMLADSFARWRRSPDVQTRRDEFRRLLSEFGLTPSSRSSLKVPAAGTKDELGEFLSKRKA